MDNILLFISSAMTGESSKVAPPVETKLIHGRLVLLRIA
jgi:hypothetical protein